MVIASEPNAYKLQKQYDNKTVVLKTLAKAVLQSKSLKVRAEQLVWFLLEFHSELFKTPITLLDLVSKKLKLLCGEDPDAISVLQKDKNAKDLRTRISEKVVQMFMYVSDSGWEKRDDEQRKTAHQWLMFRLMRIVTELKAV
ncbi:DEP domain-containing protein 7 [Camelus dromedarius]|uniref:DEP domain-containing protein 7 n=1 Tax=Camelus dromedarius TaxID=9838 RepID=A0A5N4DFF7_CAMDR|nr:DEP domain-containing protein 7 [Camelus dromedarius]